ncbi:hypothetical protein LZC95_20485 [Pendulispora brunnea]|uniref:Nucleoside 2-deoxyribosyltransferase n=1 Tax=Pendulispora brunnea TaxID=2905690 RepID=A0ABZ2KPC5_9BACT
MTRRPRVYVAAPYEDAALVREVHERLRLHRAHATSEWARNARGADDLASLPRERRRALALANDFAVSTSDAVMVLARPGAGGEMFCEARLAIACHVPVFWVGREILSTSREGVSVCEDVNDALLRVGQLRTESR